ncbi:CapA family protein [Calidifontibacillus erzurumensis]|uniref:CapA family protein n=1 Tax=Calidifontibacillus erzurumensis TaxID=2741433 RepID=UPI0035B4FD78
MMKLKIYLVVLSMAFLILSVLLYFQQNGNKVHNFLSDSLTISNEAFHSHPIKQISENGKNLPATTAKLVAVGDILIHGVVYKDAKKNNSYDFKPMLAQIKPYIEQADLAFANQETIIGGAQLGLSTYPTFNSPFEVGDALKDAGFDIVSMANNHVLDRGVKAIENATRYLNDIGIAYTGAYTSHDDKENIRILKANGILFSFLAYTYGTNGIPIPKDKPYVVNLINLENMKEDISEAKQMCDVVVVSVHFGNEYERLPNDNQKQLVKELAEAGAHIIIGHHPHVLQPAEWIETEDGRKVFVIYSLGNFLSGQNGHYTKIGGILQLDIEKTVGVNGVDIQIHNPAFLPTIVTKTSESKYSVVPLHQVYNSNSEVYQELFRHMTHFMDDLYFIKNIQ